LDAALSRAKQVGVESRAFERRLEANESEEKCLRGGHDALKAVAAHDSVGGGEVYSDVASAAHLAAGTLPKAAQLKALRAHLEQAKRTLAAALPSLGSLLEGTVKAGFDVGGAYLGFCSERAIVVNLAPLLRRWNEAGTPVELLLTLAHEAAHLLSRGGAHDSAWRQTYDELIQAAIVAGYRVIRYNRCLQRQRFPQCVELYRELAAHEAKLDYSFDESNFLFMIAAVLHKKPTAAVLRRLSDAEVLRMVKAPLEFPGGVEFQSSRVQLQTCANCPPNAGGKEQEPALRTFLPCARCRAVVYCGKDCQRKDWKAGHKEARPEPAPGEHRANFEEISKSLRLLELRLHPDRNLDASDEQLAANKARRETVRKAYALIGTEAKRQEYDEKWAKAHPDKAASGQLLAGPALPASLGEGTAKAARPAVVVSSLVATIVLLLVPVWPVARVLVAHTGAPL
uniref:MYND-type domain-containing protein n=2 Tax=Emiliania huxleyi TaxID=2903 RepID=A0A0D3JCK5_EMIH1